MKEFDFSGLVKVKRDGKRGWHWIDRAKYDANPKAYQLVDENGEPVRDPLDHDGDGRKGGIKQLDADGSGVAPEFDKPTKAEVLALKDGNFGKFQGAAIRLLGKDRTPNRKADIIAAVEALADEE